MTNPWMKFYPSDWRADPALRMCSMAARGLWMEMLCLMHEGTPRGSLSVNGRQITDRQLAGLAGMSVEEAATALAELEEAGVFSRDADGTIYSRRMRKDDAQAERDKANGRKGGNPRLNRTSHDEDKPWDNGGVNPEDKAQKPEARSQKPDIQKGREQQKPDDDETRAGAEDRRRHRTDRDRASYAFASGVIRLTKADLEAWRTAFPHLASLEGTLFALAEWAGRPDNRKNWFMAVSSALAKKNEEARLAVERIKAEALANANKPEPKRRLYDPLL